MQYYRCKCGKCESWGSMPASRCQGCEECGTTLDGAPQWHTAPAPHVLVTRYNEQTGVPYLACTNCWYTNEQKGAAVNA